MLSMQPRSRASRAALLGSTAVADCGRESGEGVLRGEDLESTGPRPGLGRLVGMLTLGELDGTSRQSSLIGWRSEKSMPGVFVVAVGADGLFAASGEAPASSSLECRSTGGLGLLMPCSCGKTASDVLQASLVKRHATHTCNAQQRRLLARGDA